MDLPVLNALEEQWRQHPPTHLLVAAFLGHQAPPVQTPGQDEEEDRGSPAWMGALTGGTGGLPASDAVRQASTRGEAIAAFERMFFGEIHDVQQLKRQ